MMSSDKENLDPCNLVRSGSLQIVKSMSSKPIQRLIYENSSSSSRHRTPLKTFNYLGGCTERLHKSSEDSEVKSSGSILKYASDSNLLAHNFEMNSLGESEKGLLFKTPQRGSENSECFSSPSSKVRTPSGSRFNPFDGQLSMDTLHLPMMSPSLFSTVLSPSQEDSSEFWTLDQRAHLFPVNISEDSPWKQERIHSVVDPELEFRRQEAFDRYFRLHHKITSPILMEDKNSSSPELQRLSLPQDDEPVVTDSWSQTELTFPVKLPSALEELFVEYMTFLGPQNLDNSISNVSLRRKLFTNVRRQSLEEEENKNKKDDDEYEEEEEDGNEMKETPIISPGKIVFTPPTGNNGNMSPPSNRSVRRTTFTPPNQLGSPLFSPICRSALRSALKDAVAITPPKISEFNVVMSEDLCFDIMDTNSCANSPVKTTQNMDTDTFENQADGACCSTKMNMDNLTSTMTFNGLSDVTLSSQYYPTNEETTGYVSSSLHNPSSIALSEFQTPGDSGMISSEKSVPFELFGLSSVRPREENRQIKSYLVSYGVDEHSNDISVGFPLGSSTPTK